MQTVPRNPEVAERHVERDGVVGSYRCELRGHLAGHLQVDRRTAGETQCAGETAGVRVERDEQVGAVYRAPEAKVCAVIGSNEPAHEQQPPLDC